MKLSDFDYELPPERIATRPAAERDAARLLVHDPVADETTHARVRDLAQWLAPGDLLVLNDTRVRPARLFARRASGGAVELLLVEPVGDAWRARVQPAKKLRAGERLAVEGGGAVVAVERPARDDGTLDASWLVRLAAPDGEAEHAWLERVGRMPLPPYVARARARSGEEDADELDRERYQTVFAREVGAVAAPTAGLHFTDALLASLVERGVETAFVTLHVGEGTFQPVTDEDVCRHEMHAERFVLPEATAAAVARCRARGGRVVAVGTTSVRVLETCGARAEDGELRATEGTTELFLVPGSRFRVVDAMLTNFHLPRSTLLMLVSAFAGRERTLSLYRAAIREGYRFYSYGDAMLLLRPADPDL